MPCPMYLFLFWYFLQLFVCAVKCTSNTADKPNIVIFIADDLGWNDVGFHGSNEILTPNIDALAYNGIILNSHYVQPTCTPSRVALMTGKYPIRTGLQGDPGRAHQPWALSLDEKILPQYLKEQGYKTHLIGKWHLGFYKTMFTPTKRGFDSHFGYYNGWIRYNDSVMTSPPLAGIDARRNLKRAGNEFANRYATDVFTNEAINVIKNHDARTPLFLELSHAAVHAEKDDILRVRDEYENDQKFGYILDKKRRKLAGTLQALDDSVGKVIKTLAEVDLLRNSVVLFISDNGGATIDPAWHFQNSASNWPLRGMKTSLFEGGVRGVAAIWSPLFEKKNYVSKQLFHISDWLPTFVAAAGGDLSVLKNLDGINQWDVLTAGNVTIKRDKRREILINIDHRRNNSALIHETWKLISNNETHRSTFADNYAGISGREENITYDLESVLTSTSNRLISAESSSDLGKLFLQLREQAKIDLQCATRISAAAPALTTKCYGDCLYDLENDPCEFSNVADEHPNRVFQLKARLKYFESITVPQVRAESDSRANPAHWDGYWNPWLDEDTTSATTILLPILLLIGVTFFIWKNFTNFSA